MPAAPFSDIADEIRVLSAKKWGTKKEVHIVGRDPSILKSQRRIQKFSQTDRPVLITGESGTGKELFAKSLYLLSDRSNESFRCTNCAQYQKGGLLVSELFGHRKGSFTGAKQDYDGLFASADGGTAFLDEVGELSPRAQAMLLRTLSEGEIKPLGATTAREVDVRVVAATHQSLKEMVKMGSFRRDLFYRLQYLHVHLPPVRERGNDWRLLTRFFLHRLNKEHRTKKELTPEAWSLLEQYHWPGNIREIKSIVDLGFVLSESEIEPSDFEHALELDGSPNNHGTEQGGDDGATRVSRPTRPQVQDRKGVADACYKAMADEGKSFWETVREPYLNRELNREQVRSIVKRGLEESDGSYKRLLRIFEVEEDDYLKFMDFLRHHELKPKEEDEKSGRLAASGMEVETETA